MIPLAQVPIIEIAAMMLLFLMPLAYATYGKKHAWRRRDIAIWAAYALAFTLFSLVLYGTRGGLPGAMVYGWPKEFLLIRAGDASFNLSYFLVDLCFYFILAASAAGASVMMGREPYTLKKK